PARLVKKLTPAVRAEKPAEATPEAIAEESPISVEVAPAPEIVAVEAPAPVEIPETKSAPAMPSRQVRVLRPTAAALNAGIRPGERAPAPAPPPPPLAPRPERNRLRERPSLPRSERLGTPGETATPQTTYIPPPDTGRRRSRRSSPRGGRKIEGKAGKFDKGDFIPPPKALSLEDRIAGRLDMPSTGELKSVRLIEGSTVDRKSTRLN